MSLFFYAKIKSGYLVNTQLTIPEARKANASYKALW